MSISILIGVRRVDPSHYGGPFDLDGPENDVKMMENIFLNLKIPVIKLIGDDAKSMNVIHEIHDSANQSKSGQLVIIYYSGHGTQFPGSRDEYDGLNESWCLPDRCLIDNEINWLLSKFSPGVRVLVISDSCHSGTIAQLWEPTIASDPDETSKLLKTPKLKLIPTKAIEKVYDDHKLLYDRIMREVGENNSINATVLQIGACEDHQKAKDGNYSVFTHALNEIWKYGNYNGNYTTFVEHIKQLIKDDNMNPEIHEYGITDNIFINQKPFQK